MELLFYMIVGTAYSIALIFVIFMFLSIPYYVLRLAFLFFDVLEIPNPMIICLDCIKNVLGVGNGK